MVGVFFVVTSISQLWKTKAKFVRGLISDDSLSMEFVEGGRSKKALIDVLHFLARLYGAVSEGRRGIRAIRFLNGGHYLNSGHYLNAHNLRSRDEIENLIKADKFQGLARIGACLMQEILKPFVFADDPSWVKGTPKKLRQMERPLLVMVITSGVVTFPPQYRLEGQDSNMGGWKVEGEPEDWAERAVRSVKRSLSAGGVGKKGMYLCPRYYIGNLTVLIATWTYRGCIPICTGW